jgi:3-isopropylmalate dehydratase small subunit
VSTGSWEEPLPTLTGRAWAFGIVLGIADLLPARYADLPPAEASRHVLRDLDAGLAARMRRGDVITVVDLRGAGDAAAAFAALRHLGIVALVARRYDAGIEDAALAARIVPVALDAPAFIHTGDRLRIDLEAAKIVNLSSGDRAAIRNLDDARRAALRQVLRG